MVVTKQVGMYCRFPLACVVHIHDIKLHHVVNSLHYSCLCMGMSLSILALFWRI